MMERCRGPVFIGGPSRSGKTLMASLLADADEIAYSPRATNMWTFFYKRYGDLKRKANFDRCLGAMLRYTHIQALNPDPARISQEFWQGPTTYARLFSIFHMHFAQQLGRLRWGDHSRDVPAYAEAILAAYSTAKIVAMVRDPRDRYAALISDWPGQKSHVGTATACWWWSTIMCRRIQARYPSRFRVIRYERLVGQPEETIREVSRFIGYPVSHSVVNPRTTENWRIDHSREVGWLWSGERITDQGVGCYRDMVPAGELVFIQTVAGREMNALGYPAWPDRQLLTRAGLLPHLKRYRLFIQVLFWIFLQNLRIKFPMAIGHRLPEKKLLSPEKLESRPPGLDSSC